MLEPETEQEQNGMPLSAVLEVRVTLWAPSLTKPSEHLPGKEKFHAVLHSMLRYWHIKLVTPVLK